jgi:hypothetical protein
LLVAQKRTAKKTDIALQVLSETPRLNACCQAEKWLATWAFRQKQFAI